VGVLITGVYSSRLCDAEQAGGTLKVSDNCNLWLQFMSAGWTQRGFIARLR